MNKKILAGSALAAASLSMAAFTTWSGANGDYRVETGFDDGTDTYGYWYEYDDSKETKDNGPGTSKFTWPATKVTEWADEAFDNIIDECGGVCGSATLGGPYKYPFVGVGFNLSGEAQEGNDISGWGGICITYKSTGIAPALEIAPADEGTVTKYDNYKASLKINATPVTEDLPWAKFKQEGWGTKVDQEVILASAAAIKFKIAGADGKSTDFGIYEMGQSGKCSGSTSAIAKSAASSVKAMVSGRTLSFAGITSAATAEVINLQGQVVLKSAVSASSALNLASLDAGVYMVRVSGKAVNMSQKVVLK